MSSLSFTFTSIFHLYTKSIRARYSSTYCGIRYVRLITSTTILIFVIAFIICNTRLLARTMFIYYFVILCFSIIEVVFWLVDEVLACSQPSGNGPKLVIRVGFAPMFRAGLQAIEKRNL